MGIITGRGGKLGGQEENTFRVQCTHASCTETKTQRSDSSYFKNLRSNFPTFALNTPSMRGKARGTRCSRRIRLQRPKDTSFSINSLSVKKMKQTQKTSLKHRIP